MKTIKNIIYAAGAAMLALLTAACTSEIMPAPENENSNDSHVVRFSLRNYSESMPGTRAIQEGNESAINNLYAVVFRVSSNGYVDMSSKTPDGSYPLYSVTKLLESAADVNKEFTITIPNADRYFITFVANADGELKTYLEGAINNNPGTSILAFKQKIIDQPPYKNTTEESTEKHTAPDMFLMTSDFYGVDLLNSFTVELGLIEMQRALARVDIYNQAENIRLTGLTFNKRAIKSRLISDNAAEEFNSANVEDSKVEGLEAIEVTADTPTPAWEKIIYSYEQYGTGDYAPSLTINYEEKNSTSNEYEAKDPLTIQFQTTGAEVKPINIKRNHIYRVIITRNEGKIQFKITVNDWDEYGQIDVDKDNLAQNAVWGYDPDEIKVEVGDFLTSEGRIIKPYMIDWDILPNAERKKIVAVVYNTDPNRIGNEAKAKLNNKVHGTAISLKYYNDGKTTEEDYMFDMFANSNKWPDDGSINNVSIVDYKEGSLSKDIDGYGNTVKLREARPDDKNTALSVISEDFNKQIPAPKNSTGWYLPAYGECIDMMCILGHQSYSTIWFGNQYVSSHSIEDLFTGYFTAAGTALNESGNTYNLYSDFLPKNGNSGIHFITYCSTRLNSNRNYAIKFYFMGKYAIISNGIDDVHLINDDHSTVRGCVVF